MLKVIGRLIKEEEGQGLVEYALIIALIAIALIVIMGTAKDSIKEVFQKISDELDDAVDSTP